MAEEKTSSQEHRDNMLKVLNSYSRATDEEKKQNANKGITRASSTVQQALPAVSNTPLNSVMEKRKQDGSSLERDDDEQYLRDVRAVCRDVYKSHHLIGLAIDIYSRFPLQGVEIDCKDPELKDFYEELFFKQLNYEEFLIEMSKEYWKVGEVTTLGTFNEVLGVWEKEQILNPDDIEVKDSIFDDEEKIEIDLPENIKRVIENQEPIHEFKAIKEDLPELVDAVLKQEKINVSPTLISRIVNRSEPWDKYGTPHMMRGFRQLLTEERLNNAQDAISDRLYKPLILLTMGISNLGPDAGPWLPTPDQIDSVMSDFDKAMAADFRAIGHHMGLDIKSVFGREQMPRLDNDFDRVERKLLQVWGIGEALISGSDRGTYASSALNREVVTQLMATHQKKLQAHFQKRAEIVAEAQEHFDYEMSDGERVPVYEEVYEVDPFTGEETVTRRPKLLLPELKFRTLNLRDEAEERKFLSELKKQGVPVSDESLAMNVEIDIDDELEKIEREKVAKTVSEQELRHRLREVFWAKGIEPDATTQSEIGWQEFVLNKQAEGEDKDLEPGGGTTTGEPLQDITDQSEAPNIAPYSEKAVNPEMGEGGSSEGGGSSVESPATRNQIRQRPEVSDEQRMSGLTKDIRHFSPHYAAVKGLRSKLSEESVRQAVTDRAWASTTPKLPKRRG